MSVVIAARLAAEQSEQMQRLTVVPCPTEMARTGRRCGATLMEAWTSGICIERRRCKQCGVWYRIRLMADRTFVTSPEGSNLVD